MAILLSEGGASSYARASSSLDDGSRQPCPIYHSSLRRRDLQFKDPSDSLGCDNIAAETRKTHDRDNSNLAGTSDKSARENQHHEPIVDSPDNILSRASSSFLRSRTEKKAQSVQQDGQQQVFFQFPRPDSLEQDSRKAPTVSAAQLMNESRIKQIQENARVAIYFPQWNRYYGAIVLRVEGPHRFVVRYVDSDVEEWIDAREDDFRVISSDGDPKISWTQIQMKELLRTTESVEVFAS